MWLASDGSVGSGTTLGVVSTVVAAAGIFMYWRGRRPSKPTRLTVQDWQPGKIYLCQFPRSPGLCSVSPFALKLESWLRINDIPYENVYTLQFSPKHHWIPYIERDGDVIDGTCHIIESLTKQRFGVLKFKALSAHELALTHATLAMLEERLVKTVFYWRYGLHMPEFFDLVVANAAGWKKQLSTFVGYMWKTFQPGGTRKKYKSADLLRDGEEGMFSRAEADIHALAGLLGDKNFFFGDEPHTLDCAVFGVLAQVVFMPDGLNFPHSAVLAGDECANLLRFMKRFKKRVWPDWDALCAL